MAYYGSHAEHQKAITASINKAFSNKRTLARRNEAIRLSWQDPERKAARSRLFKKHWRKRSYRKVQLENIRKMCRKRHVRKARSANGRKVLKMLWKNQEFVEKINSSHVHPSKPQLSIFRSISANGISGHKLEYCFGTFSIDIAFPEKKLAIEVDGKHWHKGQRRSRDRRKGNLLKKNGWKLLRVSADRYKKEKSKVVEWLRLRGLGL